MRQENASVTVFKNPQQAQSAVSELQRLGFDLKKLSIVGKASHKTQEVVAYYAENGQIKCRGDVGSPYWNNLCTTLQGWAFFNIPGIGPLLVIGSLALWIVAALENAAIFGNLNPLGATLYSIGITKSSVQDYEAALMNGSCLLIVHGPAHDVMQAKMILDAKRNAELDTCDSDGAGILRKVE
jgi:hypothetical protein